MQSVINLFRFLLLENSKKSMPINQDERIRKDLAIFHRKINLQTVTRDMQQEMLNASNTGLSSHTLKIELGAGVLPMKINFPEVVATDIVPASHLDGILDATAMDMSDGTVDVLFLQNTFHHIPDPMAFFTECERVLKRGGRVVILDPYFNKLSRFIYPKLFKTETYNLQGAWNDASGHEMVGANQALSHIIFARDVLVFQKLLPNFEIVNANPLPQGLRYLLTGGLNFKQLIPNSFFPLIKSLEGFNLIEKYLSIHWMVVLEKK